MTNGSPEAAEREAIQAALERVLSSEQFSSSSRLSRFLRFVVTETLEGRTAILKEYAIGVSVYDRGKDFDPKSDSIVRVDAVRLRARLTEYYSAGGASEHVRISIPKGGYLATFSCIGRPMPQAATGVPVPGKPEIPAMSLRVGRMSGAALAATALVVAGFWFGSRDSQPAPSLIPFTAYPGDEFRPSLSPDGRYAAFGWNGLERKNFDIYLRQIDEDKPIRLTTNSAWEGAPEWSPNSKWIVFARAAQEGIIIINPISREEHSLGSPAPYGCFGWLPDSTKVLFAAANGALWTIDVNTHARAEFASSPAPNVKIDCGKTSPDGQWLAVMTASDLFVRRLAGGSWARVTRDHLPVRSLAWAPDSESIFFTSPRDGDWGLWRVSRTGSASQRVPGTSEGVWFVSAAKDMLLFQQDHHDNNLLKIEVGSMQAKRIFVSTRQETMPSLSADGDQVAFISNRDGSHDLWTGNSDGSGLRRLTNFGGAWVAAPAWRRDGRQLAFESTREGNSEIYSVSVRGGDVRQLTQAPSNEYNPEWSPNGESIYFVSDRGGSPAIWKQAIGGGPATQITSAGTYEPKLDPNGEWLYFLRGDNPRGGFGRNRGELFRVPTKGGAAERILPEVASRLWSVTSRGVLFVIDAEAGAVVAPEVRVAPLSRGPSSRLGRLPVPNAVLSLSASVSGDRLAIALLESVEEDLMLLRGLH